MCLFGRLVQISKLFANFSALSLLLPIYVVRWRERKLPLSSSFELGLGTERKLVLCTTHHLRGAYSESRYGDFSVKSCPMGWGTTFLGSEHPSWSHCTLPQLSLESEMFPLLGNGPLLRAWQWQRNGYLFPDRDKGKTFQRLGPE